MDSQELIDLLEKGERWEDDFILKFDTETFWSLLKTLPQEIFGEVEKLIKENLEDTLNHKVMLENLVKEIEEGHYEG